MRGLLVLLLALGLGLVACKSEKQAEVVREPAPAASETAELPAEEAVPEEEGEAPVEEQPFVDEEMLPEEEEEAPAPPSNRIVFSSDREGNRDIFVIGADGTGLTNLTNDSARDEEPGISEDGKLVVYTSDRFGNREVFLQNVETGEVKRLTDNYVDDFEPDISPDGRMVIFTRKTHISSRTNTTDITFWHQLYVFDLETMEETLVSEESRQGRNARFIHGSDDPLYLYELEGSLYSGNADQPGEWARLTFRGTTKTSGTALSESMKLVYSAPNMKTRGDQEIFHSEIDGSFEKRVSKNTADDVEPSASPDENLIVFSSNRDGNWELYLYNWEEGTTVRLTDNPGEDREPDISG